MRKKIVIVDDEKPIADILQFHFQMEGFSIKCAYNGQEALELVEDMKPDMVLLDVMLPDLNGIEICKKIRMKYEMPIILLTASCSKKDRKRAFTFGANDYIMKPFHTKELVALVKKNLRIGSSP